MLMSRMRPGLTRADAVVFRSLVDDAGHNAVSGMAAAAATTKKAHDDSGHDRDATLICSLKEWNDPSSTEFASTILTTWDREDVPELVYRYLLAPYARWGAGIARHPTDVVFVTHILLYSVVSAIRLFTNFSYGHDVLHLGFTGWCIGPFTLLMHNHIHNDGVLKPHWAWLDKMLPYILGPLMGHTWNSYYYRHVKHHHIEGNGPDDLSSTIRYQRDDPLHFLHYYARFMLLIWIELPLYFVRKGRTELAIRAFLSEMASYAFLLYMTKLHPRAALFAFLIPFAILRLALMVGNWGQYALMDEIDPTSNLRRSITLIDVPSNRHCFNDGYHTGHHENPRRHWRDQLVHFLQSKEANRAGRALVFYDIDFFMMTVKVLCKDYLYLADRLVPIGDQTGISRAERVAMLRSKTKQFTDEDIRLKF